VLCEVVVIPPDGKSSLVVTESAGHGFNFNLQSRQGRCGRALAEAGQGSRHFRGCHDPQPRFLSRPEPLSDDGSSRPADGQRARNHLGGYPCRCRRRVRCSRKDSGRIRHTDWRTPRACQVGDRAADHPRALTAPRVQVEVRLQSRQGRLSPSDVDSSEDVIPPGTDAPIAPKGARK
jgi:hypothetical protein